MMDNQLRLVGPSITVGGGISRRRLLATGATTGLTVITPGSTLLYSNDANAATWIIALISGVVSLAKAIFNPQTANFIEAFAKSAEALFTYRDTSDTHAKFSYGAEYQRTFAALLHAQSGAYYGIDRLPCLSDSAQIGHPQDMNWAEIDNIVTSNSRPIVPNELSGNNLIRGYSFERRPFNTQRDGYHFANVVKPAIEQHRMLGMGTWNVSYVRDVCVCGENTKLYAFHNPANPNPLAVTARLFRA